MAHREANWPLKGGVIQRAASGQTLQVSHVAIFVLLLALTAYNSLLSMLLVFDLVSNTENICTYKPNKTRTSTVKEKTLLEKE